MQNIIFIIIKIKLKKLKKLILNRDLSYSSNITMHTTFIFFFLFYAFFLLNFSIFKRFNYRANDIYKTHDVAHH